MEPAAGYASVGRKELQAIAKVNGLHANAKSADIIDALRGMVPKENALLEAAESNRAAYDPPDEDASGHGDMRTLECGTFLGLEALPPVASAQKKTELEDEAFAPDHGAWIATTAAPEDFFKGLHQRVSSLIASSPSMRDQGMRKSFTSLSSTLLDAVIVSRERSGAWAGQSTSSNSTGRVFTGVATQAESGEDVTPPVTVGHVIPSSSRADTLGTSMTSWLHLPTQHGFERVARNPADKSMPYASQPKRSPSRLPSCPLSQPTSQSPSQPFSRSPSRQLSVPSRCNDVPIANGQALVHLAASERTASLVKSPARKSVYSQAAQDRRRAFAEGQREQRGRSTQIARWR